MKIFITGASGYVGSKLALALANQGHTLHALVRDAKKAAAELSHPAIHLFIGDVTDAASIDKAIEGCSLAIHTAALAVVWPKRMAMYEEINIGGTKNVLHACIRYNVPKLLYTSTAGSLGPSADGKEVTETTKRTIDFFNEYERTKSVAENLVLSKAGADFHTSVLNLTRVYGPGQLSESNASTKLIKQVAEGSWRAIPGDGSKYGNYVYVDDVVAAHLLAIEKARSGEKYIIGGENISFETFFTTAKKLSGATQSFIHFPVPLIMLSAHAMELSAKWFGTTPKITPSWARRYLFDWKLSSEKAIRELGYAPRTFEHGCRNTLVWLEQPEKRTMQK